MADFITLYGYRYNTGEEFMNRIEAGVAVVCRTILAEDPATANHAARLAWANWALVQGNTKAAMAGIAWAVIANPTIAAALSGNQAVPDSDIEYEVNQRAADYGAALV